MDILITLKFLTKWIKSLFYFLSINNDTKSFYYLLPISCFFILKDISDLIELLKFKN